MLVETIYTNGAEKYDISKIIGFIKELNQFINHDNKFSFSKLKPNTSKSRSPVGVDEMKSSSMSRSKSIKKYNDEVDINQVVTEVV